LRQEESGGGCSAPGAAGLRAGSQRAGPTPAPRREASTPAPVQQARSRMPDAATRARIDDLLAKIEDAYFDYDKASLRADAMQALQSDSAELRDILKDYPDYKITIEGHCDERGSAEYNVALGEKRAEAAKTYLTQIGIPADQFKLVSYGKERSNQECKDDSCWQKDRHVHFVARAN
jgi:peptidoglycan-associated lipoprotein